MKNLYKSEKGSVSIFLIIIFTVIFFFNAVLIDYARIITAKYQTEKAVKAATRSVLSSYDNSLYSNYGIFGFSGDGTEIFNEVVNRYLTNSSGYFNFVKINIENSNSSIEIGHELAYHQVFEQQILEEMKYKAPIDFTLEIMEQFSSLSLIMKEASNTTSILTDINDQFEIRNQSLLDAINYQKKAAEIVNNINSNVLNEIIANYNNYKTSILELENLPVDANGEESTERKELENNIEQYKQDAIDQASQIYNHFYSQLVYYNNLLENAEASLEDAIIANDEMKKIINSANSKIDNEQYDRVNIDGVKSDNTEAINNIKTINENISKNQDLALSEDYFNRFGIDINEQKQQYQSIASSLDSLRALVASAFNNYSNGLEDSINKTEDLFSKYNRLYGDLVNPGNKISKKENELTNSQTEIKQEKKTLEREGELNLSKVNELLNLIKTVKTKNDEFTLLDQKFKQYKNYNLSTTMEDISNSINNSPTAAVDDAIKNTDRLFLELANVLEEIRNEIYIDEYLFSRFNYFEPSNFNDLLSFSGNSDTYNNIKLDGDALAELLDISNQEIEYVIYGINNAGGNLSSALRDIFYIRLAINMIEAFTNPKVLAATNPLIILLEATIYSVSASILDITNIMQGKEVPLAKKVQQLHFGYENYLGLLYLIRGKDSEKLSRIQAVVDYGSGKDLTTIPTYVKGNVDVSIQLWFIPGVMKALNYVGILDGQVDKNHYIFSKVAAFSY